MRSLSVVLIAAVTLIGAFICTSAVASAHTTGASWNATDGDHTIDIGYDPVTFTAGQYARFDLLLWQGAANTGDPADFAQVWMRIVRDPHETVLATGIWKQPIGPTTLLFEFMEPGAYTMEVSYRDKDGNDIAAASFPITVSDGAGMPKYATYLLYILAVTVGISIGAIAVRILYRRRLL